MEEVRGRPTASRVLVPRQARSEAARLEAESTRGIHVSARARAKGVDASSDGSWERKAATRPARSAMSVAFEASCFRCFSHLTLILTTSRATLQRQGTSTGAGREW